MGRARSVGSRSIGPILALVVLFPPLHPGALASATEGVGPAEPSAVEGSTVAFGDCPQDWVCLWEHTDFAGTMIQIQACCGWLNLADVGFNNKMSSWRNRRGVDAKVAEFADGGGERLCLGNGSSDNNVGAAWNDRASSVKVFASGTAC